MSVGEFFDNLKDRLKEYYFAAEDKWYKFVDWVSGKIPAFGNVIDTIEDKGVPSFPLAIAIVLLILIMVVFMLTSQGSALTVRVTDLSGNPVEGATVTVFFDGDEIDFRDTAGDGVAVFYLTNNTYSVRIEKDAFGTKLETVIVNGNKEVGYQLSSDDIGVTKVVRLATANGELISGSGSIKYTCEETGETHTTQYSGGAFSATFSAECETISVDAISGYTIVEGRISFSGTYDTVEVEEIIVDTGTAIVNFLGDEPPGLRVLLKSNDLAEEHQQYNSSGSVVFENVPTNTYYVIVSDPNGNYAEYDSRNLGEIKELSKDETISFNVTMEEANSATINVLVKDVSDAMPLLGADVRLIKDGTTINTEVTGATGSVSFAVPSSSTYTIEVDHPDYIIASEVGVTAATENVEINLLRATESNSQSLVVTVVDASKEPIDNAKVYLKTITDDTQIGEPRTTGSDGQVEFYNLEIGTYYVYAVKEGFDGVNSASTQVLPRQESNLEVTLPIGDGEINLIVLDPERNVVSGASVKAIDYFSGEMMDQGTTNSEGEKMFSVRADKSVYFIVEMPNYMDYYTAAINPDEGSVLEREIVLIRETGTLLAQVMSIYSGGAELSRTERSVSEGIYTAKVLVIVPAGSYSEAGLHIRTGEAEDGKTNYMDQDPSYLGAVYTSADSVLRGTTFSPPSSYDVDSSNFTSGNSKWVNNIWKNPKEGAYEVETELVVTDATPGSSINLWYRAWAKGASVLRYPSDTPSQELYALSNNYLLSAGAASICEDSFCKSYSIETLTGSNAGRRQFITSNFSAKQDTTYRLTMNLTNYSGKTMGDSVLNVMGAGLDIEEITVNTNVVESPVILGNLVADSFTQGTVEFSTPSAGSATINLTINSSSKTEMENTITISVKGNKTMDFDFVPEEIIPYIDNAMFFEVKDNDTALTNVLISIYSDGAILGTVETNGEGLATFELEAPSAGDVIKITASKEGYNNYEIEKTVDTTILNILPPEISNTIKIGELVSIEEQIVVENSTVKDITIKNIDFEGEIGTYMTLSADTVEGEVIKPEGDLNFVVELKLNNVGKNLQEPKTVEGVLVIDVEVKDASASFTNEIPIRIRISRPGYLDSDSCLQITPQDIEFITSTNEVTQSITIENNCTAEGIEVSLSDLEVKIDSSVKYGSLSMSGTGFNSVQLTDTYTELADFVESELEETITLKFNPTISSKSGEQDFVISFRAKNVPEEDAEESITTTVNLSTVMSNLSSCLEVEEPAGGVTLNVAGFNMGYNRIMNSNLQPYLPAYQGLSQGGGYGSYGGMMPYGMQQSLPFMSSGSQTNSMSYEQGKFTIKNNCTVEVEIDLDADSAINVADEKFSIGADDDYEVEITPGYTLGKYDVKINAKISGSAESKEKIDEVKVVVQKLGDVDDDCIKTNVTVMKFNSFLYQRKTYKVYNYCYDIGVQLTRTNSAVSIKCEAPAPYNPIMQQQPYFQVGMEAQYQNAYPITGGYPSYGGYPQTGTYNSYNDYLNPNNECGGARCHMISTTRVTNRSTTSSGSGTVEVIDFEVRPNANYIPQRKLFDEQTNQFGIFSSIGAIRDWATQTDARTRVYGDLGVQYTNQYGSVQCMTFPIQLEDQWRIGESIDSAINYGDPNAAPSECVNKNALDLVTYWKNKNPTKNAATDGAIPEGTHWSGNTTYIHIASPSAVRIGPPPAVRTNTRKSKNENTTATKNCGYLDKLSSIEINGPTVIEGVKIRVKGTTSGTLLKNNRGPNLIVEVDRSGMIPDCLEINTTVKAKLRRMVNWDTEDVFWPLNIKVVKAEVDPSTIKDCKKTSTVQATEMESCRTKIMAELAKDNTSGKKRTNAEILKVVGKICENYFDAPSIEGMRADAEAAAAGDCSAKAVDYGFKKIDTDRIENLTAQRSLSDVLDCTTYFCTHDQAQTYLLSQYMKVNAKLDSSAKYNNCTDTRMLSELYKEAGTKKVTACDNTTKKFYTAKDNSKFVSSVYADFSGTAADAKIPAMISKIDKIDSKDIDSVMVVFAKDTTKNSKINNNMKALGMTVVGNNYYMPAKTYKALIKAANNTIRPSSDKGCAVDARDCILASYCEATNVNLDNATIKYMATDANPVLVKLVGTDSPTDEEIELIYTNNAKLDEIHELATFDSATFNKGNNKDILLTQMTFSDKATKAFEAWVDKEVLESGGKTLKEFIKTDKNISFKETSATVGQYQTELDFNYCNTDNNTANVKLGDTKDVDGAKDAKKNVLLKKAFITTPKTGTNALTAEGTIIDASANFYARAPMKITITTIAGEKGIIYKTATGNPTSLINWNNSKGIKVAGDERNAALIRLINARANSGALVASLGTTVAAQTLSGIYYAPEGIPIIFYAGQKNATINAKNAVSGAQVGTQQTTLAGSPSTYTFQMPTTDIPNLKKSVEMVTADTACISTDGSTISWNEKKLLGNAS